MMKLLNVYDPKTIELRWQKFWVEKDIYQLI